MKSVELDEVASKLSGLIPAFNRKLIRPLEKHVKFALSPMQMHVLFVLSEKESYTMTELSNELKMSKQQMTPLIDKLIDNGLVQRENDKQDRRSLNITITQAGANLLEDIHKNVTGMLKEKIMCLDKEDLVSLHQALSEFYRVIHKIQ